MYTVRMATTRCFLTFSIGICLYGFSFSEDIHPKLLVANDFGLSTLDLNTGHIDFFVNGSQRFYFMAYHQKAGYIYWTNVFSHTISRLPFPPNGKTSAAEILVAEGYPVGIAIDPVNNCLYWSDYYTNNIKRSTVDGSNITTILSTDLSSPWGLTLDLENGLIYFADYALGKIEKCKLDGSARRIIINSDYTSGPVDIALDFTEQRLYWTDVKLQKIKSATFDGHDVKEITSGYLPLGIAVFGDYLYYSQWSDKEILRVHKSGTNREVLFTANFAFFGVEIYETKSECFSHTEKRGEEKRSTGYRLDLLSDTPISDKSLESNWYRFVSENGDKIGTHPPGILSCGTYFPVWLNETLPDMKDGNVEVPVCLQTVNNICENMFTINITNCGMYYVYYLQKTPANSSYCIGEGPVKCPKGLSSQTGFYPGCNSSFPNITVSPTVEALLIDGQSYNIPNVLATPSLLTVFRCKFEESPGATYIYDVYWYINTFSVISHRNIPYKNIFSTDLKDSQWMHQYNMNMEVQCSVRVRYSSGSLPGPFIQSPVFKAGLYPDKHEYTVIEGEYINVPFTLTVPVGCFASNNIVRSHCTQNFYVFQPQHAESKTCINNIANRVIVFEAQFCGLQLPSIGWNNTKYLKVHGFSDGLYNVRDRSTQIRLSTTSVNDIWKNMQIPDIKVTVIDKDRALSNRLCQSYNDPHITTVDGRSYHYMAVGEFVMYRNDKGPYWVHALFTNCGFGWEGSSCHCGIAVRSRNSLFVLRTCEKISRTDLYLLKQPLTELITCDDSDLLIEHSGSDYKITLPIGTEIRFSISSWSNFIAMISIKPSVYDINTAKGLCGVPSVTKDSTDDFTLRNNGPISDDQIFAASWRILPNETLFDVKPAFLNETVTDNDNRLDTTYCVCEQQAGPTDTLENFNSLNCNLTASTEYCSNRPQSTRAAGDPFPTSCPASNRQKRSLKSLHTIVRRSTNDKDDVLDFKPLIYDSDVDDGKMVAAKTYRNGWTAEKAYQTCSDSIRNALPSSLYGDFVDLPEEQYIQSCVKDIELVGDTTFLADAINAVATFIITEVTRNESLYSLKTSNDSQTVLEYLTSYLCPNNCSGNGNCSLGVCSCYEGYVSNDCSQQISTPPSSISLPSNGLCTLGDRECKRTNVYGNFMATTVWYKLKHFEIRGDTIQYDIKDEILKAEYRNRFMVSVDLGSSRRKRSTSTTILAEGYDISLSNDKSTFGKTVTIIIYDESCYSCNASTITCTTLDSCPTLTSTQETSNDKTVLAIATPIVVLLVIIAVIIGLIVYKNKGSSRKKIDILDNNTGMSTVTPDLQSSTNIVPLNKEYTDREIELDFDDGSGTPVELFVQTAPISYVTGNHNTKFNPAALLKRQ